MFFPLSTIKKFHAEVVFVAWLRDCLSVFSRKHFKKVLKSSVILFAYFFNAIIVCICHCFRWMSWPLRARASQLVHSSLSSFFAWCRAQVCRSGWKDICTLHVVQYTQTATTRQRQFANRSAGSRFVVNRKSDKLSLIIWKRIPEVNLQDTWKIFRK